MKKTLFLLTLMICTSYTYGQIGIRGGLNYSRVNVDPGGVEFGSESKVGYHIGLQGDFTVLGLKLRPALLYHTKGGKESDNGSLGNTNLKYIELPLNLSAKIGTDKFGIIFEAGPYFGYLLETSSGFIDDIDDRLKKSDWGMNFGVVIELAGFGFGANYSNSLQSISLSDQITQAFKTTNGNLALFGYMKF